MIHIVRALAVLLFSVFLSWIGFVPGQEFFNTMFSVNGIFCSIGYSVIISFDLTSVTNQAILKKIRINLKKIGIYFAIYLAIAALSFMLAGKCEVPMHVGVIKIIPDTFLGTLQIFCLIYFIINYRGLLHLKDEILDAVRKEREKEQ
jgi:hypothetical protein